MTELTPQNGTNLTLTKDSTVNPELQNTLELKKCLYSICESMCINVVQSKPKDIPNYMINYLKSNFNYSSSGLRFDEQKELEYLRAQVEMFKDMEEHSYYSEQSKIVKKEVKPVEKKGRGQPKPKARLPLEENILSDDEDYKNLEDVDPNLDNIDLIKSCLENNKRVSVTESNIPFDKDSQPNIKTHKKNPDLFDFIRINLIKSPVFSELNYDVLKCLIDAMEEKNIPAVTDVVKQGDLEEAFYFVVEGQLECKMQFTKITQEGNRKKVEKFEPKLVRIYNPGDYFGELSLLYHIPRRGTIRTVTDVKLYSLSRTVYKYIIRKANEEKTKKIIDALKKVEILSMLEEEELQKLETLTKEVIYTNGEIIIKENEFSNTLMILDKGKCLGTKCEERGKIPVEKTKYKEGDVLFEKAILRPEKSDENIMANSDMVKFICIDRNGLKNNLGQYESILMRNMDIYQKIFPPEEEKKEEEEKKKEEEEKKKEEEEKKKEEERKKKEEEKNVMNNIGEMSNNDNLKINPNEQIIKLKEEHQKEIDDFQRLLKEKDEQYEKLLAMYNQQKDTLANPQFNNNAFNNNFPVPTTVVEQNNMNNIIPGNEMNNMEMNPKIFQENNNIVTDDFNKVNQGIKTNPKINDNIEEDKKSASSKNMELLKDKLIYNENEQKILSEINEPKIEPEIGGGSIIEA